MLNLLLRICAAASLAAMAGIHLYLWELGYRTVPTIGLLFLLNGIGGGVLTLAVLLASRRLLGLVSSVAALFIAGTLGALILSLTVGLFGFLETLSAPLVPSTIVVESIGTVVCGVLAARCFTDARRNWATVGRMDR